MASLRQAQTRHMPRWATPERRAHLVRLFLESGGFCVFGERPCSHPELHHYQFFIEGLIREWVCDDREQREAQWRAERERMHRGPKRYRQGQFDTVARERFLARQPSYYVEATGVDALTFRLLAKVKIPSSNVHLFVDISGATQGMSKNARRKAARYRGLPREAAEKAHRLILKALKAWWAR